MINAAAETAPAAALVLMFALGARHGIEPDHMAAIDGMTLRAHDRGDHGAPWVGTLFAIGHGVGVTLVALAIHLFASGLTVPPSVLSAVEWIPLALLFAVGALNLRALLGTQRYQPASVRGWLIPARWRERSDAAAALLVGLLFALVLDVVTQLSAWSYSATGAGTAASVLVAGVVFSAGLVLTATLDSQLLCRLLNRHQSPESLHRYRRGLGWFVVLLSFGMALYGTADKLGWLPEAEDLGVVAALVAIGATLAGAGLWRMRRAATNRKLAALP